MSRERITFLDLYRAFGIILMIMGHVKFGTAFDKWIHAFHMPMFFFVSGWFFKGSKNISNQISRKARSLLLPYLVFEIVLWLASMPFIAEYRTPQTALYVFTENTYKIPIENGTFGISPIPGALWFLTALFFIEVIYNILDSILGLNWKLHVLIAIFVVIGMLLPGLLPVRLPWAMDAAFAGLGFFHMARVMKGSSAKKLLELKLYQSVMIGVLFSGLIMVCPKVNMRTGNYGWYIPFLVNAFGAIIAGWNLAKYIDRFLERNKKTRMVYTWLLGVGRNSIVYLCLNQAVILGITKTLDAMGLKGAIVKILILVLSMVVLFGFEKLICNTKLNMIIGRNQ